MAEPIAYYKGEDITCYPSSNSKDNGKLQLEFNMARLVTRLSSKNFCIIPNSFLITQTNQTADGKANLEISAGQASINGMDLIMTKSIKIAPPAQTNKTYYIAFKLQRNSNPNQWDGIVGNVLGDLEIGTTTTFEGVYLTYFETKVEDDPDRLYIGSVKWDGTNFKEIKEDTDKYGNLWAKDIMAKIQDPKHPTVERLLLQEWITKVPDWYFSKEGDVCYGEAIFTNGRGNGDRPGIKLGVYNGSDSIIEMKNLDHKDNKLAYKVETKSKETNISIGESKITSNKERDFDLELVTPNNLKVQSDKEISVKGKTKVQLTQGQDKTTLELKEHILELTDATTTNTFKIEIQNTNLISQSIGSFNLVYNKLSNELTQTGTTRNIISSETLFKDSARVEKVLSLGVQQTNIPSTHLSSDELLIQEQIQNGSANKQTSKSIELTNTGTTLASITVQNKEQTRQGILKEDGSVELKNSTQGSKVLFQDSNIANNISIDKILNKKALNISGELQVQSLTSTDNIEAGQLTTNNSVVFKKGDNNASISKVENKDTIYTSNGLNIGLNGNQELNAGNTTINGTLSVNEFKVDTQGNVTTNGTISAAKVYNACYNDIVEFMEKADPKEVILPGDVAFFNKAGKITKQKDKSVSVAGIVSTPLTYGYALGGEGLKDNEKVPIALCGRVFLLVPEELKRKLKAGDLIYVTKKGELKKTRFNRKNTIAKVLTVQDKYVWVKVM